MLSKKKVKDFVKRSQKSRSELESSPNEVCFRKLSKYISILILIPLRFTPNMVTVLAIFIGLAGCVLLVFDNESAYVFGSCFMLMFLLLDYCDGDVARYLDRQTMTGHYLDYFGHVVMFGGLLVGMTCGIYRHNPSLVVIFVGMLAIMGVYIRILSSTLIWEVICVENLRKGKRLSTSNPNVTYETKYQDVANEKTIQKTRPLSIFRKVCRLVLWPSCDASGVFEIFCVVTIVNCFIPTIVLGEWVVGIMDVYFLYLCSMNIAFAVFLIAQNVRKGTVELRYKEFFDEKQGEMDR
jgi:phosphatidylglycerophosphate synthase